MGIFLLPHESNEQLSEELSSSSQYSALSQYDDDYEEGGAYQKNEEKKFASMKDDMRAIKKQLNYVITMFKSERQANQRYRFRTNGRFQSLMDAITRKGFMCSRPPQYGPELARLMRVGVRVVRGQDWKW